MGFSEEVCGIAQFLSSCYLFFFSFFFLFTCLFVCILSVFVFSVYPYGLLNSLVCFPAPVRLSFYMCFPSLDPLGPLVPSWCVFFVFVSWFLLCVLSLSLSAGSFLVCFLCLCQLVPSWCVFFVFVSWFLLGVLSLSLLAGSFLACFLCLCWLVPSWCFLCLC